jgi:type II secretory pathway component PulM
MTITALRPRERRLLLAAGALAVGLLGYTYGVEPALARHHEIQELITARRELLDRQHRLLGREERYAQEKADLDAEVTARQRRLLPGDKAPLAASELQKLIKVTAQETGVEVRSERILPTAERGGYTEVPIEVTLSGPIRALAALVYRLEDAPVLLTVNDLKIRVVSVSAPRELSATLAVTGYIHATAPDGGRAMPGAPPAPPARRPGG